MRFWQMIMDRGMVGDTRVLSPDAVRVVTTDQIPGIGVELLGQSKAAASWGFGFGVAGTEAWNRFGGGTTNPVSIRHGGAGGIFGWIDPVSRVVAVSIEVFTEVDENSLPQTAALHRLEDVLNSAVLT